MSRDVYIQLPPEEYVEGKCEVAKLRRALYGTRDAPLLWQADVARVLSKLGFIQGVAHPCVFHHPSKQLALTFHVDDFAVVGPPDALAWLEAELRKNTS